MERLVGNFENIFINEESKSHSVTKRILQHYPADIVKWVSEPPLELISSPLPGSALTQAKKRLYVSPFKGSFFKRCPGAKPNVACCNYYVLNLAQGCDFDCTYCFLQNYSNLPYIHLYSNLDDALREIEDLPEDYRKYPLRIGTGEITDSLSLDPLTLYSNDLILFFSQHPYWFLELKTKSKFVDQFLDVPHANNIIISWSLNPQIVIDKDEHGTASLSERLHAAKKCAKKGFILTFHFVLTFYGTSTIVTKQMPSGLPP